MVNILHLEGDFHSSLMNDAEAPVAAEKLLDDVTSNTDSEPELKSSTIGTALNMLNELEVRPLNTGRLACPPSTAV